MLKKDNHVAGLYATVDLTTGCTQRNKMLAQSTGAPSRSVATNIQHPVLHSVQPVAEGSHSQVFHENILQGGVGPHEPACLLLSPLHLTPS
jgi:hypothetical protein